MILQFSNHKLKTPNSDNYIAHRVPDPFKFVCFPLESDFHLSESCFFFVGGEMTIKYKK